MFDGSKGKQNKKYCDSGWRCPVCRMWFEWWIGERHLREMHPAERETLVAEATKRAVLKWSLGEGSGA